MNEILNLIGRSHQLFDADIKAYEEELKDKVTSSNFLVLGGAGSIGQSLTKEIYKRKPKKLYVVDINENNLTELVRDIRSSFGYIKGKFKTFALDISSSEYDAFINSEKNFDYVLNLSALKHVRSEEDPFTLMRMIYVNIFNTDKTIKQSIENNAKKYFCVSTDKATNPVNMMGASKRIMEMFLIRRSSDINISSARFANVAFSDGSLLYGFNKRLEKKQPIAAPNDVKRYFLTPQESGELCLMSCILGENRDIFFPKLDKDRNLLSFSDLAVKFLKMKGFEPYICNSEEEAREQVKILPAQNKWPCFFSESNTTGEKTFEEFYTTKETPYMDKFESLGILKNDLRFDETKLDNFEKTIKKIRSNISWDKKLIVDEFYKIIPDFKYFDINRYLDEKM
jgi:FlaA1/EpsC-like NDP-sugar epimerase